MSYIRAAWAYTYVDGESDDYIFSYKDDKAKCKIEDYGHLSNNTIIELLYKNWQTDDELFKEYLLTKLAKRLKVKLRKKPLTDKQVWKDMEKKCKRLA